jgi:hypothetical protein
MVDHEIFAHEIELMNVSGAESDFLLSFLNYRTQFVCVRDTVSTTSRIDIGLPQGSPASPMMFNMFVNRIFQCNFKGRLQMYADDVALLIRAANLTELMSKLQSDVDTMNEDKIHRFRLDGQTEQLIHSGEQTNAESNRN